ncbi:hypothetical protein EON66_07610 [archaeon]|nr:MAG: hypothetical protein EON66_07610 [archaeon]
MKFKRREAAAGEPPIPEIIQKDQVRGAYRVTEFDPDIMVITVEVAGAKDKSADAARPLFQHNSFPVENRAAFGVVQSHDALKRHLQRYSSEPYQKRLSDFHALLYLAQAFDEHTAVAAAKSVKAGTPLDEGVEIMLSAIEFS